MIDVLAEIYERKPIVCLDPGTVSTFFRVKRGRLTGRRCHGPDFETQREVAIRAGVPVSCPAKAEADPEHLGFGLMKKLAAAHGYEAAVIFFKKD